MSEQWLNNNMQQMFHCLIVAFIPFISLYFVLKYLNILISQITYIMNMWIFYSVKLTVITLPFAGSLILCLPTSSHLHYSDNFIIDFSISLMSTWIGWTIICNKCFIVSLLHLFPFISFYFVLKYLRILISQITCIMKM